MVALLAYLAFSVTLFNAALLWFNVWLWKDAKRERQEASRVLGRACRKDSIASLLPTLSPDLKRRAASSRKLHRYLNGFGEHPFSGPRV